MNNNENLSQFSENIKQNNLLQIKLVERAYEDKAVTDEDVTKWVIQYSAKFRELVSKLSADNLNFWSDLENEETKENLLKELEGQLYRDEDFQKAA